MGRRRKGGLKAIVRKASRAPAGTSSKPVVLRALGKGQVRRAMGMTRAQSRGGKGGWSSRNVSVSAAYGRVSRNRGPSVNGRGSTVVSHSEYLGEVPGSVAFDNRSRAINPGLVASFPWLANIAIQYEQYKFRKLSYRYETEAPSTKAGAVLLVTDYDALDAPFVSKDQAMQYKGASRTVTWTRCVHNSLSRESNPYGLRYVRSGAVPEGGDQKTYDVGLFQTITGGQDSTAVIGEMYVDYVIELVGPKTNNILGANLLCADIRAGGTMSAAAPLGNAPTEVEGTTIDVAVNNNSVTLGSTGRFLVYFIMSGTGITDLTLAAVGGATFVTGYGSGIEGTTEAWYCFSMDYQANQGNGLAVNVTATTVTSSILVISQISGALALPKPKAQRGLPKLKLDDPVLARLKSLEALVKKMGLGCPQCEHVGDHAPNCPVVQPRLRSATLKPTPTGF